ncbi:helix-turn-helix domain-containing protein [Providencia rettgeri]|uniref:helix-turn-helix domain-containing protein n=1 Tax=Providencia rettgeri TaxID=587 RepID=UPI001F04A417|nr:helix-turn-helix transcriptional regulator [Providencia rettgeri]MCG9951628.1 helix-turn-helix domain-containing protein [Providencia rettgeri]
MEKSEKFDHDEKQIIHDETLIRFKERLKSAMGDISNLELSRKSGVSESVIRRYLSGKSYPGLDKLIAIANAVQCSVEWLATGNTESNSQHIAHDTPNKTAGDISTILNSLSDDELSVIHNFIIREGVNSLLRLVATNTSSMTNRNLETIIDTLPLRPMLKNAIKIGLTNNGEYDREILHALEEIESQPSKDEVAKSKAV